MRTTCRTYAILAHLLVLFMLATGLPACAQSVLTPITSGLVWTTTQWTNAWQGKQDYPATTAIPLFRWTTGTRPGSPATGALGYNTTLGEPEWYSGSAWVQPVFNFNFSGNPNIATSPTGNPTGGLILSTYSTVVSQGITANSGNREFLANFGLTSNTGSGASNGNGDKVTLYAGAVGQAGTGDLWAFNPLLTMSAGSGTYNAQTIEVDFNPLSVNMGGTDGSAGMPSKVANGISISGASDANVYKATAALAIDSFGGPSFNQPLWSRGITFNGYYQFAEIAHYAISPVGEDLGGIYSIAALRVAGGQKILLLNSGSTGAAGVSIAGAASGTWTFTLPASAGSNGQPLVTDGFGNTSWFTGGVTCSGSPTASFAVINGLVTHC